MKASRSAWIRNSLAMLGFVSSSMSAGAAVMTSAEAFAGPGFVCCAPFAIGGLTSGFGVGTVADRDVHASKLPSSATAAFFDQLLDPTTPSGYAFRDGSVATADASIGTLSVAADAKAFSATGRFGRNNVSGTAEAFFVDELNVKGPVSGRRMRFDLGIDGFTNEAAGAAAVLSLQGSTLIQFFDGPVIGGGAARQRRFECLAPGGFFVDCDGSVILLVPTFTPLSLNVVLAVVAAANGTQESVAAYDRTLHTTIEMIDPGSFETASGFNYAAPVAEPPPGGTVPEPVSSLLLGAGLIALMASLRQKSKAIAWRRIISPTSRQSPAVAVAMAL